MTPLLDFLDRLWAASIYFTLSAPTPRAVVVPGERWEIEFRESGDVAVEVFASRGGPEPGHTIEELFRRFGD